MKSAIYLEEDKFIETIFKNEKSFEKIVKINSKTLFGSKTMYLDLKNKIETKSLGSSIPDGFLFDFKDRENPEFYIVEVELAEHDFYKHIFPQITKFFAFFKNSSSQTKLIEKLFAFISSKQEFEEEFKQLSGRKEIYKTIKDLIETSQNILIIINENKPEFKELSKTYTDTWDKMVKLEILKEYKEKGKTILSLNPDFEGINFIEPSYQEETVDRYSEKFHIEDVAENIISIYEKIKNNVLKMDSDININPQKYYISFRKKRNFAFLFIRTRKIHLVIMLPYNKGKKLIKKHNLRTLSKSVQAFYNGPCFKITISKSENLNEIIKAIKEAYKLQN